MLKIFIGFVVASVAVIAALIFTGASLSQYVAVLISLLALTVSIVSAFKEDIFSFQPVVLFDEIIMAPPSGPSTDSIALVLPLTFINKGHGAGVVNMLALRVESADGMKLYTPLQQVDFEKYISGRRKLHAENIKGSFNAFALGSRATSKMQLVRHLVADLARSHSQRLSLKSLNVGDPVRHLTAKSQEHRPGPLRATAF